MIHQYKLNGYNIVLDIGSGSIHVVDDLAYDCIENFQNIEENINYLSEKFEVSTAEIESIIKDIENLKINQALFSKDEDYENIANLNIKKSALKALCLHVSHTCNFTCEYCFARGGVYQGSMSLMPYETGKQAIDFLIANSGTRRNLDVDFFGGEPLMNFETVTKIVEYARTIEIEKNKKFRFTLTTNGLLLTDEITDFLNKEMSNVVLSLDGRPQIHDKFRKTLNNKGSYDIIVPKFKNFVEKRKEKSYYIRGTFTHHNVDFTNDIFHMADLGFNQLSMEPVVCSEESENALTIDDLPVLFEQYEVLAKAMASNKSKFSFYHYNLDLSHGPCIYKRIAGCGSGSEYMAVTPEGDLYPCHQFVMKPEFKLGNIYSGIQNQDIIKDFKNCNLVSHTECKDCWAKLYCSGGCAANNYNASGSIHGVYKYGCELFKKRIECAIYLQIIKIKEMA